VREGLVPAANRVDTVVVPLGGPSPLELAPPEGGGVARLRANLMQGAGRLLAELQRVSDGPEGVNSPLFGHVCGFICTMEAAVAGDAGRRAWQATNERILERILWAVRRDPGRRVLVAMQCRRVHWLGPRLKRVPNIELVDYRDL
jgi:hypothetical protein